MDCMMCFLSIISADRLRLLAIVDASTLLQSSKFVLCVVGFKLRVPALLMNTENEGEPLRTFAKMKSTDFLASCIVENWFYNKVSPFEAKKLPISN